MNSYFHAKSAAKKWGGKPADYLPVEEFIDSSKQVIGDSRHRSLYHHTLGVWLAQKIFGVTITITKENGGTVEVPVRLIAEQHIIEDLGWLPSPADYLNGMPISTWMSGAKMREEPLSALALVSKKIAQVSEPRNLFAGTAIEDMPTVEKLLTAQSRQSRA